MACVSQSLGGFPDFGASSRAGRGVVDLKRSLLSVAKALRGGVPAPEIVGQLRSVALESIERARIDKTAGSSYDWIESVESFLIHLEDSSCSEETLRESWLTLPSAMKSLLERFDEEHPREILHWIDAHGNNRLEQLLEALYALREPSSTEEELLAELRQQLKPCDRRVDAETSLGALYHSLSITLLGLSPEEIRELPDERLRVAIVKQLRPSCVSEDILAYGIRSQGGLIEVAMHFARLEGWTVSENIHNYGIISAEARFEILKVVIASNNSGGVFANINNYGIVDQRSRLEVLDLVVDSRYREEVPECIDNYGIETLDEDTRIELARRLAINSRCFAMHFQKFKISSERVRIEIAELVAVHKHPAMALAAMKSFEISDESARIRIAMLVTERDAITTSMYIGQAQISSEEARVAIAMLAVRGDVRSVSKYIRNYGIVDQGNLVKIAKMGAQIYGEGLLRFIDNYKIESPAVLAEIQAICWLQMMTEVAPESIVEEFKPFRKMLVEKWACRESESRVRKFLKLKDDDYAVFIEKMKNPEEVRAFIPLLYLTWFEPSLEAYPLLEGTVQATLDLRNPQLKWQCSLVLDNLLSTHKFKCYQELVRADSTLCLPLLFVASWGCKEIPKVLRGKRQWIDDSLKMMTLLNTLQSLHDERGLRDEDRNNLMYAYVSTSREFLPGLRLLGVLCKTGYFVQGVPPDLMIDRQFDYRMLLQKFAAHAPKVFGVEMSYSEYEEHLETRVPYALATYASRIRHIPEVMDALRKCIEWTFSGEFKVQRYNPENSAHLRKMAEDYPGVLLRWQAPSKSVPLDQTDVQEGDFSLSDFFYQQLVMDKHFPDLDRHCPSFAGWLLDRASPLPESFANPLEEALVSLCVTTMEKSDQLRKLKEINAILAEHFRGVEFINDIRGRLYLMSKRETTEELEVARTDTYKDLVVSGTEVVGSCQHVEGDPQYTRALLAYVNDGKNQMLVVRSVKTGRIEARCIFRLLFRKDATGIVEPVLFEDRVYPAGCKPVLVKALHECAIAEADRMGLPLYTINEGEDVTEETALLVSLGSVAPFEYEDAAGGVTDGTFVIQRARKVKGRSYS